MKICLSSVLLHILSWLPWSAIQFLGWLLGTLLARIPCRVRRDALINIRLCLPHLNAQEQLTLRHNAMLQFGCTFVEMAALWLWPISQVLSLIREETGIELLQINSNEALILLTPHLGAWELAGLYVAARCKITSMYRPLANKCLDQLIYTARQRNGAQLVPDNSSGIKRLLRVVKDGGCIGILPDQVTREESGSMFAPFFNVPAVTMLLVAGLARRSKARVVFVYAERLPKNAGFHIHCFQAPLGIDAEDEKVAAAALNCGIEQCIMTCPEQYQWNYRRFRRRPNVADTTPYVGPYI